LAAFIATGGISEIFSEATIKPALAKWARFSELTADRAGYLACQDKDTAIRAFMKLAGYPPRFYSYMRTEEFVKQAEEFNKQLNESIQARIINTSNLWDASHPYTVLRAAKLIEWLESDLGGYIPQMNRYQLEKVAKSVNSDSLQWELTNGTILKIAQWANEKLKVPICYSMRELRRVISGCGTLSNTDLEKILMIELRMLKTSSSTVLYESILLFNAENSPEKISRVTLQVMETSWEDVPTKHREEYVRLGKKEQNWILYSAGNL
jgi:hypothetical protein